MKTLVKLATLCIAMLIPQSAQSQSLLEVVTFGGDICRKLRGYLFWYQ